jgi:hypothetical protein
MTPAAREREIGHLRQVINTAKVVVALTAAIAATFVAGTLQVTTPEAWWDHTSAVLMLVVLILSFWLITRPAPSRGDLDAETFNDVRDHARCAHRVMQWQVFFSGVSCATATMGLLWPTSWPQR